MRHLQLEYMGKGRGDDDDDDDDDGISDAIHSGKGCMVRAHNHFQNICRRYKSWNRKYLANTRTFSSLKANTTLTIVVAEASKTFNKKHHGEILNAVNDTTTLLTQQHYWHNDIISVKSYVV